MLEGQDYRVESSAAKLTTKPGVTMASIPVDVEVVVRPVTFMVRTRGGCTSLCCRFR